MELLKKKFLFTILYTIFSISSQGAQEKIIFQDSFDNGTNLWKSRYRSQLAINKDDAKGKDKCLAVKFDRNIFNGCGTKLSSPIKLSPGGNYIWSFYTKNQQKVPVAVSIDGKKWHIIRTASNRWRQTVIKFTVDGKQYSSNANLFIVAFRPSKQPATLLIDEVKIRQLLPKKDNEELNILMSNRIVPAGSKFNAQVSLASSLKLKTAGTLLVSMQKGYPGNAGKIIDLLKRNVMKSGESFFFSCQLPDESGCYFITAELKVDGKSIYKVEEPFGVISPASIQNKYPMIGFMVTDPGIAGRFHYQKNFKNFTAPNLQKVIKQYNSYGVNMYAVTNIWPWWEPESGQLDFDLQNCIAKICNRNNVMYQIKIQQWSLPKDFWCPNRVQFQNGKIGRSLSLWDDKMINAYCKTWQKVATSFKGRKGLFSYAPTFGLEENSIGNDYGGPRGGMADYSPLAQKAWQNYLQKQFSLKEMEKMYSKQFNSWDKVAIPIPNIHSSNPVFHKLWSIFIRFRLDRVKEVYEKVFAAIREVDQKTLITFKLGKLYPVEVECGPAGSNGYDVEDIFMLGKKYGVAPAFTVYGDPVMSSITYGFSKLYGVKLWAEGASNPEGAQNITQGIARRRVTTGLTNAIAYSVPGIEIPYYPATKPDSTWAQVIPYFESAKNFQLVLGKTYLGYFPEDMWGTMKNYGFGVNLDIIFNEFSERLRWRQRNGFQYGLVTARMLSRIPSDSIIFDPGTLSMNNTTVELLVKFVNNGGTFICNRYTAYNQGQSPLLKKLFNANLKIKKEKTNLTWPNKKNNISVSDYASFNLTPTQSLISHNDDQIIFIKNVGKGKVLFNGLKFPDVSSMLPNILSKIEKQLPWHNTKSVYVRTLKDKKGNYLIIATNPKDEFYQGHILLGNILSIEQLENYQCIDLVSGKKLSLKSFRQGMGIPCQFIPGMFQIFKLSPKDNKKK